MGKKHQRTRKAVFTDPVSAGIAWRDVEAMLVHHGGLIEEGAGSRVAVMLNGVRAVFHRPHPRKEASQPLIRDVRAFLIQAGVVP